MDAACVFNLYAMQGVIQGLAFGTMPLLLRRNAAATDKHQSLFSMVGYPFSFKFLIAPLVDGVYWQRLGKRESWIIPLQLVVIVMFSMLAGEIVPMLEENPPRIMPLTASFFFACVGSGNRGHCY